MFRSVFSVFGGMIGMILRCLVIIGLCGLAAWFLGYVLTMPFVWGGLIRLAGIALCVLAIRWILRAGRDKDDSLPEEDFRS